MEVVIPGQPKGAIKEFNCTVLIAFHRLEAGQLMKCIRFPAGVPILGEFLGTPLDQVARARQIAATHEHQAQIGLGPRGQVLIFQRFSGIEASPIMPVCRRLLSAWARLIAGGGGVATRFPHGESFANSCLSFAGPRRDH
jgi:hypothetical protein